MTKAPGIVLSTVAAVLLAGCCFPQDPCKQQQKYIISVNSRSLASEYGGHSSASVGESNAQYDKEMGEIEDEFNKWVGSGDKKELLIFVHGGLNGKHCAVEGAIRKLAKIGDRTDIFPIFVTWESGLASSYMDHLLHEANGINYSLNNWKVQTWGLGWASGTLNFATDMAGGFAESPRTAWSGFAKAAQGVDWIYNRDPSWFPTRYRYTEDILALAAGHEDNPIAKGFQLREGETLITGRKTPFSVALGPGTGNTNSFVSGVSGTITAPLQVAISPIYEGLGAPAWRNMQRRAATMVRWSPTFVESPTDREYRTPKSGDGVFAKLLSDLGKWQRKQAKLGRDVKITLVGHSMGTIVLNEAFREINRHHIRVNVDKIIYMAAACNIRDALDGPGVYIQNHRSCEFHNLCLHPKRETGEKQPWTNFPLTFSGSLLVWIDQFFEQPRDFLDRTFGSFENCIIARKHLPQQKNFHLKAFGNHLGSHNGPQNHGDFGDFRFWEPAFYRSDSPDSYEDLYIDAR